MKNGDVVADAHRLLLVVSDEEEGDSDVIVNRVEFDQHSLTELEVERGERFIEQQNFGFADERAGDGDTLALTAAELSGFLALMPDELDEFEILLDFVVDFPLVDLCDFKSESDIVPDGHVGKERIVLEDRADFPFVRGKIRDVLSVENDASGIGSFESPANAQQCGFTAAAGTEQREDFPCSDGERNVVKHGLLAVTLRNVFKSQYVAHLSSILRVRN